MLPPQPAIVTAQNSPAPPDTPRLGQAQLENETKPAAPEVLTQYISTQYPDIKPYGAAVLLLVLLDDQGRVQDVKIAIPSAYTLQDLTLSMGLRDSTFTNIEPPLAKGEYRWVELRFDFGENKELIP